MRLPTHRPLFRDVRVRRAVNYALDRRELAALGDGFLRLPSRPTDHYLPPGMSGYRDVSVYPPAPDLAKARALAHGVRGTAVLVTCNRAPCTDQAQIAKTDLGRIGIHVQVEALTQSSLNARIFGPSHPWDMAWAGWEPDYFDPSAMLDVMEILKNVSKGGGRQPEFLATHPLPETRLDEIRAALKQDYPDGIPRDLTRGRPLPGGDARR